MSANPSAKRLISLTQAADNLGVDPRTIRRYVAAGRLPAYRVGPRLIKIDPADLAALVRPCGAAS